MKHLKEGLIKQKGIIKNIPIKDILFQDYNICVTGSNPNPYFWGYHVVLLKTNKFNNTGEDIITDSTDEPILIKDYDYNLNYKNSEAYNILEVWRPKQSVIKEIMEMFEFEGIEFTSYSIIQDMIKNCELIWKR